MSLAAHSIISEKQSRSLEPLLATPLTPTELLLAKVAAALAPAFLLEMLGSPDGLSGNQLGSGHADGCAAVSNVQPASVGDVVIAGKVSRNGGLAELSAGATQLSIPHGLISVPSCIGVTPSKGPAPEVSVGVDTIDLTWGSPPGPISVWWTAQL